MREEADCRFGLGLTVNTGRHSRLPVLASKIRWILTVLLLLGMSACQKPSAGLERVQTAGVLRVATDPSFPPFESVNASGEMEGLDVDLARAVANELGVQAHFVTTGYDGLYDALTAGRADAIVSALYPDPARSHGFLFSSAYFNAGYVLVVSEGSGVAALEDLAGRSVVCVFGTTGHTEMLRRADLMATPPVMLTVNDPVTLTQLLHTGEADAVVTDRVSALMAASGDATLRILDPPVTDEPYVFAVRKEDASLAEAIDAALAVLAADGTLNELVGQWMKP
jgi:ABC-type amino acid transport substrate-binding protein